MIPLQKWLGIFKWQMMHFKIFQHIIQNVRLFFIPLSIIITVSVVFISKHVNFILWIIFPFQVLDSLCLPNFNGTLNWKNAPEKELSKFRNEYTRHYDYYRKKIRVAERNKKQPHILDDMWRKLEVPFLSLKSFPTILDQFNGKRTAGKETWV